MSPLRISYAVAVALTLLLTFSVAPAAAAATPARTAAPHSKDHPVPGPAQHIVRATDQVALKTGVHAAGTAGAAPFLTRPYWGAHSVTSVFDHCNPDYSLDGRICDVDGTVATRGNGVDPSFNAGYAVTPGGTDYLYYDGHNGWDISLNYETLLAAADGVVQLAGCDPYNGGCNAGFGLTVTIDHQNGFTTRYGHMSQIYVSAGQTVHRGDQIGVSGNTGASTGPHLHFGLYLTSQWIAIDPWGWNGGYADPWPSDAGDVWLTGNPQNPVPWAPTGASARPGSQSATVTWSPPGFDGGSGVGSYVVTASPGGASVTVPGSATTAVVPGLSNGTSYTFTVTARNGVGSSPASDPSNAVIPTGLQFAALPATSSTTDFAVSWSGPTFPSYDLTVSEDGGAWRSVAAGLTATSFHFYGLAGHRYQFAVAGSGSNQSAQSTAVAVAGTAATPFPFKSAYSVDQFGQVYAIGSQPAWQGPQWNWDIARGISVVPSGEGGFVLDGWGGVHSFGSPGAVSVADYWPGWDIARDVASAPDGNGGYVLDGWGGVHTFTTAGHAMPAPAHVSGYWPGWDIARRLVVFPDGSGGYVLDGWGGVHPFSIGSAAMPATPTVSGYWPGWDITRGITLTGSRSGYTVDGWGGVHPFNGAQPASVSQYWRGQDLAVGVFAGRQASAGWTVRNDGATPGFGAAPQLPTAAPGPGARIVGAAAAP